MGAKKLIQCGTYTTRDPNDRYNTAKFKTYPMYTYSDEDTDHGQRQAAKDFAFDLSRDDSMKSMLDKFAQYPKGCKKQGIKI